MGVKKSIIIGGLILFLTPISFNSAYGFKGSDVGTTYKLGKNVLLGTDEVQSERLVAAGANVEILGDVTGRLRAFGAHVVLAGNLQGEAIFGGADAELSGRFHKKVKGGAANLILSGTFEDSVEVAAAKITITPTARIKGDLIYRAAVLEQQKGSQIMGKVIPKRGIDKEWIQKGKKVLFWLWVLYWVLSIPALIILGALLNYFFPRQTNAIVAAVSESPWKNLGVGLVILVVVPVGVIIALITLVGIPVGIIVALLYGIALYVSRIYVAVWIGRKVLGYFKKSLASAFSWPLVAGTIITTLLIFIPIIGWLFRFFFALLGLGAMWLEMWKSIQLGKGKSRPETSVSAPST
jgi:cytoskeletal protein CcmA (bactofilin family)